MSTRTGRETAAARARRKAKVVERFQRHLRRQRYSDAEKLSLYERMAAQLECNPRTVQNWAEGRNLPSGSGARRLDELLDSLEAEAA